MKEWGETFECRSVQMRHAKGGHADPLRPIRGSLPTGDVWRQLFLPSASPVTAFRLHRSTWTPPEKWFCIAMAATNNLKYTLIILPSGVSLADKYLCCPSSCGTKDKEVRQGYNTYWLCHKPPQQQLNLGCNWG